MIKYLEYDSIDETGQHIIPVNSLYHMNKTASGSYSPEIMKVILNMKRKPNLYYVVINAVGSMEIWGANRNADDFPKVGISHKSLRTDMATVNDYGYKTFEYYAKLFKHHVNKDPQKSFGDVIFSHWNPVIERVELIVGIDKDKNPKMIEAIENGDNVSVSMGCKVRYDRCSICENKAKTKKEYCKHLKNYLGQIVDRELAALWSRELGRTILPGIQVTAHNDHPRFFDISEVYIGADRTSYVLGKAASLENVISSIDIAEVNGITDEHINKLAMVGKQGEIEKEIGGALGPTDIDGAVVDSSENIVLKKALNENINKTIAAEPILPKDFLNSMSTLPIETIFSTMLGMGIYPKPAEVQRIIIVKSGHPGIADQLEDNNEIFDYEDDSCPCQMNISNNNFSNTLGKLLIPYLEKRSCFPYYLKKRIEESLEKTAYYSSTEPGKDYWLESGPGTGPGIRHSDISPATKALGGLAAIYAGLKLKSMGYGPKRMAEIFTTKPWLRMLLSGGVFWKLQDMINQSDENDPIMRSASDYSGVLQDSNFSGHIKQSNFNDLVKLGEFGEAIILPCSYIANAAEQKALITERKHIISGSDDYLSKIASAAIEKNYLLTQRDIDLVNCGIQKILQRIG